MQSPYGFWRSPITSDLIVAEAMRLDQVALDGEDIYWSESQPQKQGRYLVYRYHGGSVEQVTADGFNVRTRVHEYGGGAFVVRDGTVYFSNFADQRVYRQVPGGVPEPITAAAAGSALRYADAVVDERHGRLICVCEDHTGRGEAVNSLVSVGLAGARRLDVLVSGNDFYSTPRLSAEGARLAWLTWNHPDMPWIAAEVWVGEIQPDGSVGKGKRIAGGPDEAVFQPEWSPDGTLYFVSDRGSGWWNLYRWRGGAVEAVAPMTAEFGWPQWVFGMSTYAFESERRIVCCFVQDGVWRLAQIETATGRLEVIPTPFTDISQVRASGGRAVFVGGSDSEPAAVVELELQSGAHGVIRPSALVSDEVKPYVSSPEAIAFPSADGRTAHAFYYAPRNPEFAAPEGERTPVLVKSHGGPTSAASSTLSLGIQYWTSRGIGVLDVNYGGSTGYGRAYRLLLERQWGIVDVEDCIHGARYLVEQRNADAERMAISGGSAGGYTTLRALTLGGEKIFSAGASYYGVSDLAALARDTHKFESRYLDWLIGPYPEAQEVYAERSPISHVDRLSVPVVFFQGTEDAVVPPNQTEMMVQALRTRGVPVGYFLFDGEQHGFRKSENIKRSLDAELYFYAVLLLRSGLWF
jgi:dipeptidyl aminopeptidase/acylaminoacyl peptidase